MSKRKKQSNFVQPHKWAVTFNTVASGCAELAAAIKPWRCLAAFYGPDAVATAIEKLAGLWMV